MIAEYVCACCGEIHSDEPYARFDGRPVCEECYEQGLTVCERCGGIVRVGEVLEVDGHEWCSTCFSDHANWCDNCQEYVSCNTYTVIVSEYGDTEEWCGHCVDNEACECYDCGEFVADRVATTVRGEHVCPSCLESCYTRCSSCNDYVPNDDIGWDDETPYCCDCWRDDGRVSYGHTSGWDFRRVTDDPTPNLFLGIELEVEGDRFLANSIHLVVDGVECKRDSSLDSDRGCEIVSQPFTPAYHLTTDWWDKVFAECRDYNATSHNNGRCGLHMHINRSWLDEEDMVFRLDRLIQNHRHNWIVFSRRSGGSMCDWARIETDMDMEINPNDPIQDKQLKWRCKKGEFGGDRYRAVNTSNEQTVELRLFRGTLKMETFRATVEAVAALAIIARTAKTTWVESSSWDGLCDRMVRVLDANGLPSEELVNYLTERELR